MSREGSMLAERRPVSPAEARARLLAEEAMQKAKKAERERRKRQGK